MTIAVTLLYNAAMRFIEALRGYFTVGREPQLTPEELAEARILREVLQESGAPELLIAEKQYGWGRVGEIVRTETLIRDEEQGSYRLETAMAYPRSKAPKVVVAVGAYRLERRDFGVYVASNDQRVFEGHAGDERLQIDLGRAIGGITLQMVRGGIL